MSDSDSHNNSGDPIPSSYSYGIPIKRSKLSDSGDSSDDDPPPIAKKKRLSHSSSGAEYTSTSDHQSQESDGETPPSFINLTNQQYSFNSVRASKTKNKVGGIGERMLKNAGYVDGRGLGKHGQGRVEPIETSTQRGRTGLGFQAYSKGKGYDGPGFDPTMEAITAEETPIWMKSCKDQELDRDTLEMWMQLGPRKMTIDDELEFCDESLLQDILSLKTNLDDMTAEDLRRVRSACNPFEQIGSAFFINRAALKMANMDAVFNFMFTDPRDANNRPMVGKNQLLYFADVCAGPGGFTEYVLWKKKWMAKGFGFTLKGNNDFKLGDLHACSTETFFPFYGTSDDGDIFNPENLESLKKFVLNNTDDKGVHFMMADGGFSVEGQENIQEILSKQLYLCQCLTALSIVRTGGHFLVKLFDVFTEFSVGLIYLMYRSFEHICIHKPNTSRPANSERYLICKYKRASCESIEKHLTQVNRILWQYNKRVDQDVTHLVPLDVIKEDSHFFQYIYDSNNRIGDIQKVNLLKVIECHNNPKKYEETRHKQMREACLKLWKIPDIPKSASQPCGHIEAFKSILKQVNIIPNIRFATEDSFKDTLKFRPKIYSNHNDAPEFTKNFPYKLDWKFIYLNSRSDETADNKFSYYLGSAGSTAYELIGNSWKVNHSVRLPADTLILAERVQENSREGHAMKRHWGLHIIDAVMLGGVCLLHKPLEERYNWIALFCLSHSIPPSLVTESSRLPMRCKKLYELQHLPRELEGLVRRQVKRLGRVNTTAVPNLHDNSDLYFVTKSILFIKVTKHPWVRVYSRSHAKEYFFNVSINKSSFDLSHEMMMNVFDTFKCYAEWPNAQDEALYLHDPLYQSIVSCTMR